MFLRLAKQSPARINQTVFLVAVVVLVVVCRLPTSCYSFSHLLLVGKSRFRNGGFLCLPCPFLCPGSCDQCFAPTSSTSSCCRLLWPRLPFPPASRSSSQFLTAWQFILLSSTTHSSPWPPSFPLK